MMCCKNIFVLVVSCMMMAAMGSCKNKGQRADATDTTSYAAVATPTFCADSAMAYVERQLRFGYRAPGYDAHHQCAKYLQQAMQQWCDTVICQQFNTTLWDNSTARGQNIIASFNPEATSRILLAAHWDSRLWADHDADPSLHHQPILGANDGASGVGVLMEVARAVQSMPLAIGVDIIFFDLEDQGVPEWADRYDDNSWCKGSQHWATHPHQPYYQARFGILLDMVGCHEPRFTKEGFSRQYASMITDKVWQIAAGLGYGSAFQNQKTDPILDDHLYINRIANIPTVDIVQHSVGCSFYEAWHTVGDNLDAVSPQTLKMVGDVVLQVLYSTQQSIAAPRQ